MTRDPNNGFTAIEIMVVVAVIGILAAIAYPAYKEFVERSRRSEATEALMNAATLQEQFYNDNKSYSDNMGAIGLSSTTANQYYGLQVVPRATISGTFQEYTLNATALGAQADDTECGVISLDSSGNRTPAACW